MSSVSLINGHIDDDKERYKMTNFEHIKNMDVESFAMFIAMDRKRTIEELAKALKFTVTFPENYLYNDFSALMKYLESERDAE